MDLTDSQRELLEMIQSAWHPLGDKAHETPGLTLKALTAAALRRGQATEEGLKDLVRRRISGEPLAYLTGVEQFMGLELESRPGAMIPRRETEILGSAALTYLRRSAEATGSATMFDLCTGSGNLVLALAHHEPRCVGWGGDLSQLAIDLAHRNCLRLGLEERVGFVIGDFLEPFRDHALFGSVDLLVCNPPYISSGKLKSLAPEIADFEPLEAFDGGSFGVSFLIRLTQEAHQAVRPGGWIACEAGVGQGEALCRMFSKVGHYDQVEGFPDSEGNIRAVVARRVVHT